jgi:hypothetical protein
VSFSRIEPAKKNKKEEIFMVYLATSFDLSFIELPASIFVKEVKEEKIKEFLTKVPFITVVGHQATAVIKKLKIETKIALDQNIKCYEGDLLVVALPDKYLMIEIIK